MDPGTFRQGGNRLSVASKQRPNRLGAYIAAAYLAIVVAVYLLTQFGGKPDEFGYRWIPFLMLAMPWSRIAVQLVIPAFLLNAAILYLLGTLLENLRRRVVRAR
jgi:hypothetical protein